jgi:hypothetical protein
MDLQGFSTVQEHLSCMNIGTSTGVVFVLTIIYRALWTQSLNNGIITTRYLILIKTGLWEHLAIPIALCPLK